MKNPFVAITLLLVFASTTNATDRFFADISVVSPSGRYKVDATSPDNKVAGYKAFQSQFTYELTDVENERSIWTREQPMGEPLKLSDETSITIPNPQEASPVAIYVSDSGFTVVYTAWNELIVISLAGQVTGKVGLLDDAFTKQEREEYVHFSTAGPIWSGLSMWYFIKTNEREYFTIRPWWGRRIFVEVDSGKLRRSSKSLIAAAETREQGLVLQALQQQPGKEGKTTLSTTTAAYLAGVLKVKQAIPLLRKLEKSDYSGSCTFGGMSFEEDNWTGIDPHSYCTFTHRQVAQLSLRRLGMTPTSLPCHSFDFTRDGDSNPFDIPSLTQPRSELVKTLKNGMNAEQVLKLIGSPDFITYDCWSYDIDDEKPFSLNLRFDNRLVNKITREPPLWISGDKRDQELAY